MSRHNDFFIDKTQTFTNYNLKVNVLRGTFEEENNELAKSILKLYLLKIEINIIIVPA